MNTVPIVVRLQPGETVQIITSAEGGQPSLMSPPLDAVLTPEEAAQWLRFGSVRQLMDAARRGKIAMMKIGHKTPRFHVRTVLKKLRQETGEADVRPIR